MFMFLSRAFLSTAHFSTVVHTEEESKRGERDSNRDTERQRETQRDRDTQQGRDKDRDTAGETQRDSQILRFFLLILVIRSYLQIPFFFF